MTPTTRPEPLRFAGTPLACPRGFADTGGMIVHREFVTGPHECAYLPDRDANLRYLYMLQLSAQEYEDLMNAGYRKFGPFLFLPVCEGCRECRPIRIPVERFQPDRSQRRAWKRNEDIEVRIARPTVDVRRLDLYHRYHAAQTERKGWPEKEKEPQDYALSFVNNPIPGLEISLWECDTLRGVVLTDVTPNVVSGVYHYYEPDLPARSLGTFCMLQTLELARRLGKPYAYFGYYVAGCGSLAYKARFRPCEIMNADGVWVEVRD
jgi:arginyl-tRNA--protein-N-Asp/Glu arginylyltransferase